MQLSGVKQGSRVLDIAGGTGDLSQLFREKIGEDGELWLTDINLEMLSVGRDRMSLVHGFRRPHLALAGGRGSEPHISATAKGARPTYPPMSN